MRSALRLFIFKAISVQGTGGRVDMNFIKLGYLFADF
jgi:hypothetical protein